MTLRRASQLAKQSSTPNPSGAVFTRDEVVIAGGYSLVPDCLIESQTELSGLQVALALAIKSGVSLDKSKLCVTHGFDEDMAKLLILAGVRRVESYLPCTEDTIELLEDARIEFELKKRTTK
jgi:deoxycytidylate deaminase